MVQFKVKNEIFDIPKDKLEKYPQGILYISWKWENFSEDPMEILHMEPEDFKTIVNFYDTGKWPNRYLRCNRIPCLTFSDGFKVEATLYFNLPDTDEDMSWENDLTQSPSSTTSSENEYLTDREYKDRDCLWGERLHQEKLRREDERAEWDGFDVY